MGHWLGVGLGLEGRHRAQPPPRVRVLASVTLVQGSGSYAPGTLLQHVCSMLGEVAYGALLVRPCLSFLCLGCELRIPFFQCFFFYYSQRDGARWAPRGWARESGRGAPRARFLRFNRTAPTSALPDSRLDAHTRTHTHTLTHTHTYTHTHTHHACTSNGPGGEAGTRAASRGRVGRGRGGERERERDGA